MLGVIGDLLLAVLALFGLVLAVILIAAAFPVVFRLQLRLYPDDPRYIRVTAAALGGRAPQITLTGNGRSKADSQSEEPAGEPDMPTGDSETSKPVRKARRKLPVAKIIPAALRFLRDVLGHVHFHHLRLYAHFGTGDPAETGELYGKAMPFVHGSRGIVASDIVLHPEFNEEIFEGEAEAAFRVRPLSLVPPVVRLALDLFRAWRG